MTNKFIVVGFYTDNYRDSAFEFVKSCIEQGVSVYVQRIDDQGGWRKNTSYKPKFLLECMDKFNCDIVYVDVDAKFVRYPELFNTIEADIGYWRCNLRNQKHLASGTLYLSHKAYGLVSAWASECSASTDNDQTVLDRLLDDFDIVKTELPMEYCQIFDWPLQSDKPVIVHYQASRRHRHD